jgi:hypothetical protein
MHQQTIKAMNNSLWCSIWQIWWQELNVPNNITFGIWILELQITWLTMENGLETWGTSNHHGLWKFVMVLDTSHCKSWQCHCPCKMGKQNIWRMYFMFYP